MTTDGTEGTQGVERDQDLERYVAGPGEILVRVRVHPAVQEEFLAPPHPDDD